MERMDVHFATSVTLWSTVFIQNQYFVYLLRFWVTILDLNHSGWELHDSSITVLCLQTFDSSSSKCYSIKLFSLISICRKNWSNTSAIHFTMNSPFLYSFKLVYFDFVQQWFFSYYLSYYMSMKKLTAMEIDSMLSLLFIVPLSFRWKEYVSHIFDTQQYIIFT